MNTYQYSVSTNTLWTSFDYGTVVAESKEEARKKAIEQLKSDFKKVNDALKHCDNTIDFSIHFDESQVQIEKIKKIK